ncbi:MAG: tetratricopeptide repeat protein [Elusimicrobiota bacterium]|jgi:tetratricopeptide (TPR) repeat protein
MISGVLLMAACLLAAPVWGETGHLEQARELMAKKQWSQALDHLKAATTQSPESVEAWDRTLECAGRLSRSFDQMEAAQKLLQWRPADIVLYNTIHALYGRQGQLERGLWYGEQAVRIAPKQAELHYNLGVTYSRLERNSKAIAAYQEAVRLDTEYLEARLNLADLYRKIGHSDEALATIERVLGLNPDHYTARLSRGAILEDLHRFSEAVADYQVAIQSRPDQADGYRFLGLAYHVWGRNEDALSACQDGLTRFPKDIRLHACVAVVHQSLGNRQTAESEVATIRKLDPAFAARFTTSSRRDSSIR